MEMEISPETLKKGVEIEITSHKNVARSFKLAIRYNELFQRFEVYRHFYRTRKNEIEYHSKDIRNVVDYIMAMYGVSIKIKNQ